MGLEPITSIWKTDRLTINIYLLALLCCCCCSGECIAASGKLQAWMVASNQHPGKLQAWMQPVPEHAASGTVSIPLFF